MAKNTIYDIGEQIGKLVQEAVDAQDFSDLSSMISQVIGDAADGLEGLVRENIKTASGRTVTNDPWGGRYRAAGGKEAADRIKRQLSERQKAEAAKGQRPLLQVRRAPGLVSGRVQQGVGYTGAGVFGLLTLLIGMVEFSSSWYVTPVATVMMGALFGLNLALGISGTVKVGRAKRFQRYEDILAGRTFIEVRELADGIGKSVDYVRKDLSKMIEKGFFADGHLDQTGTWLMISQESYQQYLAAQKSYEQRSRAAKQAVQTGQAPKSAPTAEQTVQGAVNFDASALSPECKKLIEEGNRYIAFIHDCNDRLPGEEISDKLDRLEHVITRIFQEVARRPQLAPELRKMMSYYLPTTEKLLDAYCSLEEQQMSGTNIDKTKHEIEDALDTINKAFENLLDGFFEHTSWDISSDISVLNNMFAQEGLTGESIASQVKEKEQKAENGGTQTAAPHLTFGAAQSAGKILDAMGGASAAAPAPEEK